MTSNGVGGLVDNLRGAVDGEAVPFLHGGAIDGLLVVLEGSERGAAEDALKAMPTEKVIQEIGSASGMSVFLTRSRVRASSSKATV